MAYSLPPHRRRLVLLAAIACFLLIGSTGCIVPGSCGPGSCGPAGCGPFGGALAGLHGGCGDACADSCNGCGSERYYDEWVNHPPMTDPCDDCGNFNGQTCAICRPIFGGFLSIWGYRCNPLPVGCPTAGCDNLDFCGGGSCGCEPTCGPSCGAESFVGGGAGCSSCVGGHAHHSLPPGEVVLQSHQVPASHHSGAHHSGVQGRIVRGTAEVKPYQPQRERQIFHARTPAPSPHSAARR